MPKLRLNSKKKNKSMQRLYDSMNRVNRLIAETKINSQRNEQYYKSLIQHSATGLIAIGQDNTIEIANDKACELVGILVQVNFSRLQTKDPELWSVLCKRKAGETETYKIFRDGIYHNLLICANVLN
jgi:signal transduction histidine kinase